MTSDRVAIVAADVLLPLFWRYEFFLDCSLFFILYHNQTHRMLGEIMQYNSQVHMCHFVCACL